MIVVTAPTGHIGSRLVPQLLVSGEPVRLIVREPAKLPSAVAGGAEVIVGSHRERDVVDRAFTGADSVFWLMPADPAAASPYDAYVTASIPAADAV
ncbi:MAG TPA: NAD(P)H-binding protein, partial [Humibacter sp.]|nr:NAD(P)H-binding protein [Humibacter sp.]